MKRIALILNGSEMVRSYLQTNLFNDYPKDWELYLYSPRGLLTKDSVPNVFSYWREFESRQNNKLIFFFFDVLRWKNKKHSVSFTSRNKRLYPNLSYFIKRFRNSGVVSLQLDKGSSASAMETTLDRNSISRFTMVWLAFNRLFVNNMLKRWILLLLAKPLFFPLAQIIVRPESIRHKELYRLLKLDSPDVILYPTSGFEVLSLDTVSIGRKICAQTIHLFDNWDNLSSKTILWKFPDFICTWGEQSSQHAIQISKFPKARIFEIGSARFTNYLVSQKPTRLNLPDEYILFVGSFLNFDEYKVLSLLDTFLMEQKEFNELRVVYRPHPEGVHKNNFALERFNRVILDPQIAEALQKHRLKSGGNLGQFGLDYYPQLLSNSIVVIGGLTSMLIEASIFGKFYITMEHNEAYNLSNPATLRNSYTHFKEIERLSNLIPCKDLDDLPQLILPVLSGEKREDLNQCLIDLDYFVKSEVSDYPVRLRQTIENVLESKVKIDSGGQLGD